MRFARQGGGKSGGVRVIYYNRLENGKIFMLLVYAKAKTENIPAHILGSVEHSKLQPMISKG